MFSKRMENLFCYLEMFYFIWQMWVYVNLFDGRSWTEQVEEISVEQRIDKKQTNTNIHEDVDDLWPPQDFLQAITCGKIEFLWPLGREIERRSHPDRCRMWMTSIDSIMVAIHHSISFKARLSLAKGTQSQHHHVAIE